MTAAASRECGLLEGTPVAAGAGDQPAGLLGGGYLRPGALCDVSGSSTLLFQSVDSFRPDTALGAVAYIPSVLKDSYHAMSYVNGGGIALHWLRDSILSRSAFTSYEELTRVAAALPAGADGLLFLPYLGGRQCPHDASFRGGWLGLNWGHRPEHLFRSMLEGLTYDCAVGLKNLRRLFPEYDPQKLDSYGGGSKNSLWSQIKASVLGLPVRCLESHDFAIPGCALLAARAVGEITEFDASRTADAADCPVFRPGPGRRGGVRRLSGGVRGLLFRFRPTAAGSLPKPQRACRRRPSHPTEDVRSGMMPIADKEAAMREWRSW